MKGRVGLAAGALAFALLGVAGIATAGQTPTPSPVYPSLPPQTLEPPEEFESPTPTPTLVAPTSVPAGQ